MYPPNHRSIWLVLCSTVVFALLLWHTTAQGQSHCAAPQCLYLPAIEYTQPTPTPTREVLPLPTPTLTPRHNDVYIHSARIYRNEDEIFIWGEIANGTNHTVWRVNVTAVFVTDDDEWIARAGAGGFMPILTPRGRSPFAMRFYPAPYVIDENRTQLYLAWRSDTPPSGPVPIGVAEWSLGSGSWGSGRTLEVLIVNTGDRPVQAANIALVYYNERGDVEFAAIPDYLNEPSGTIAPGETTTISQELRFLDVAEMLDLDEDRAVVYVWGNEWD